MENSEYLVILTTPSRNDGVRLQIERTVGTHGKHRDLRLKQLPHMETAIQTLRSGTGDIVAMSALIGLSTMLRAWPLLAFCPEKSQHGFWWPMTSRVLGTRCARCASMNCFGARCAHASDLILETIEEVVVVLMQKQGGRP